MQIKYKQVKRLMPHCGDCGEMLRGNGSYAFPYECSCGVWQLDCSVDKGAVNYFLIKKKS